MSKINIAIDGHVSSGKSSLAHGIANALGIRVLDTGAIYRGLACAYSEKVGDEIVAKATGYDRKGKLNLSRKELLPKEEKKSKKEKEKSEKEN